jgi:hypothetical protein
MRRKGKTMKGKLLSNRTLSGFIILVCLLLVAWAPSRNTKDGGVLAPEKASDLVTLIADSSTPICPATTVPHTFSDRLLPDGTRAPFTVPSGHVLVITSFDWVIEGSTQANNNVWTAVTFMGAGTNNSLFSGAAADSIGRAAGSTIIPNGVVVGPSTVMCLDFVAGANDSFARVHGFLAEER